MVTGEPAQLAFPTLSEEQILELARCAGVTFEKHPDGETLIDVGDSDSDFRFHVVCSGAIEILDLSGDEPRTIVEHGPGQFSGDVR